MGYKSNKQRALSDTGKAVAKGIFQAAADIVNLANLKAPIATGQLAQSGRVVPVSLLRIGVRFTRSSEGGFNVAERMEFDESLRHPIRGQAKYLRSSIDLVSPKMADYVRRYSVR